MSGIPTLVLLDGGSGKVLTTDGRTIVMEDPEGKDFPWKPKKLNEAIPGKLVDKDGVETTWSALNEDVIGIYFSAHWVKFS